MLGALALLISTSVAQSSYPTAAPVSLTASGAPYPMPNNTATYHSTGTGIPSSSVVQFPGPSVNAQSSSSVLGGAGAGAGAGAGLGSGSGPCGPATVTETAYQTVYTTVTPSSSQTIVELNTTRTSTSTVYQTIQVVNAAVTSSPSSETDDEPATSASEVPATSSSEIVSSAPSASEVPATSLSEIVSPAPSSSEVLVVSQSETPSPVPSVTESATAASDTSAADVQPTSTDVVIQTAVVSPVPQETSGGYKHRRGHVRRH